jgi:hypothetical protein
VRVSTAFNKILGIVGATVAAVTFTPGGIVIGLRRRRCPAVIGILLHEVPTPSQLWSERTRILSREVSGNAGLEVPNGRRRVTRDGLAEMCAESGYAERVTSGLRCSISGAIWLARRD